MALLWYRRTQIRRVLLRKLRSSEGKTESWPNLKRTRLLKQVRSEWTSWRSPTISGRLERNLSSYKKISLTTEYCREWWKRSSRLTRHSVIQMSMISLIRKRRKRWSILKQKSQDVLNMITRQVRLNLVHFKSGISSITTMKKAKLELVNVSRLNLRKTL